MEILQAYSRIGESAERCFAALEILSAKLQGGFDVDSQTAHSPRRDTHSQNRQVGVDMDYMTEASSSRNTNQHANGMDGDAAWSFNIGTADFDAIDFDIDDLLWLNSSGVDGLL